MVINKNKLYTYVVTICMVIVLFVLSLGVVNNNETVVTSSNIEENNSNIQNNTVSNTIMPSNNLILNEKD